MPLGPSSTRAGAMGHLLESAIRSHGRVSGGPFSVQEPPPENGDGQTFHTADGRAELTIYGTNNLHSEEPQAYVQHNVSLCDVTYKKIGADFYAVFGTRGATIYYERCNFPNMDVLSCFYVSYPAAEKAKWDAIVTRIGQSLRFALRGSQ